MAIIYTYPPGPIGLGIELPDDLKALWSYSELILDYDFQAHADKLAMVMLLGRDYYSQYRNLRTGCFVKSPLNREVEVVRKYRKART